MPTIAAQKTQLRLTCKALRETLSPAYISSASERLCGIAHHNISLPSRAVIAGYAAFRNEPNILPLLQRWAAEGHTIALPCIIGKEHPLVFRTWDGTAPLIQGRYGIAEPDPQQSTICEPEIFLVPMLAFDEQGRRLGYGAGYYDRSFAALANIQNKKRIGVCWEALKQPAVPTSPHDHPMHAVVTEERWYSFSDVG